jgi:sugar/nucleoside kinase (ribokinase family)
MTGRLVQMSGVIVDLIYRVDMVPLAGQEARVFGAHVAPGGGFNAMVAARRAGMSVAFGGTLGCGPLADLVESALQREGITQLRDRIQGPDQGCCTVLVDSLGERTFIAASWADGMVSHEDLGELHIGPEDWVLLSGYALTYPRSRDALTGWLRGLPQGSALIFDPGPRVDAIAPEALAAALAASRWVSANRDEAAVLTGLTDEARAAEALAAARPYLGGAVVRAGGDGCWLAQPGQQARHVPGHPVTPIDTNGAGDAHIGHFIAALARGDSPLAAARLANVAAALSTLTEGPSTAPTLDRTLAEMPRGPDILVQT